MKISIIGAGNAGCAHAVKLTEIGHNVTLIKSSHSLHELNFEEIQKNGGIWCIDNTKEDRTSVFYKLYKITRDFREGLMNADVVIILTQSLQHQIIAERMINYCHATIKMILIIPGNLGSLYFYKYLNSSNIILAEGESTPFDARIIKPGLINILFKNVRNALSFLPSSRKVEGLQIASQLVDTYRYSRNNIIESCLHNPNLIVHTVGVIMSASRIEMMKGEFWMYRESFTPSIWNLIEKLDNEKNSIIEYFGGKRQSYLDACKFRNEYNLDKDSLEVFKSYANSGGPKGPDSLNTRYLYEDVQNGLCTLSLLGNISGIETPITNSLIHIASSLIKYDFFANTKNLYDLGLNGISTREIINLINR